MKFFPFKKKALNRRVSKPTSLYRMSRSVWDWAFLVGRVGGLVAAVVVLYGFFVHSTYFDLREVQVGGNYSKISKENLLRLADVPYGHNVFAINLYKIAQNIRRDPWIAQIVVRRVLPHGLYLDVQEYDAKGVLSLKASTDPKATPEVYLVSDQGVIFKKAKGGEEEGLPLLTGIAREQIEKYPRYFGPKISDALNLLVTFGKAVAVCKVTELHYQPSGFEAVVQTGPEAHPMKVFFGKGPFEDKLKRFAEVVNYMSSTGAQYRSLDMHVDGKIFAQAEKTEITGKK